MGGEGEGEGEGIRMGSAVGGGARRESSPPSFGAEVLHCGEVRTAHGRALEDNREKVGERQSLSGPAYLKTASKGRRGLKVDTGLPTYMYHVTNIYIYYIVAQTKDAKQHPPHCLSEARKTES